MRNVLVLCLVLLAGCTTVGPKFTAPPPAPQGKSTVFLMRTSVGEGNFWPTNFSLNGVQVTSLYDKGYSWIHVDPGVYKISAGNILEGSSLALHFEFNVEAGREYYIEYNQEVVGYPNIRDVVRLIEPGAGATQIRAYSYNAAKTVQPKPASR